MKRLLLVLTFPLLSYAQTGPGGVGNSTSNGLWLKADDINQINGSSVASWSDASGNANNAVQTTAGLQPNYFTTRALNGMPIIRLDGTDDEMAVLDSPILDGTTGITFYAVLRPNNLSGAPRGILGKRVTFTDPTNYAYTWFFWSGNRLNLDVDNNNNRFNTGATTFSNATNYILGWDFDGTLAAGSRSGIRNGSATILRSTETSSVLPNSNQNLAIGALNVGYGTYLGADYAEIIQYNYAIDTVDHILVQNYLSAKYNIALASNDLYDEDDPANGDFDFDVAGIGQVSVSEFNDDAQGSGIVRVLNPANLDNNEFLIWGHDNGILASTGFTDLPAGIEAKLERDWSASETGEVGTVTIRFDLSDVPGPITTSDLRLLIDADGIYNSGATIIAAPVSLGSGIYEWTGIDIDDNDHFTIGSINYSQTPLPIELFNFNAYLDSYKTVQLDWQTESEINNDYFTVERSQNGTDWEELSRVNGAGNSSSLLSYQSTDKRPYSGISYYRLKQTDFNGEFEYSPIRSVSITSQVNSDIIIYPNPTSSEITIIASAVELEQIKIFNILGQELSSFTTIKENNGGMTVINLSNLSSGMYIIKTKTTANKVYKQ